ncbi:putative ferric-chelate reductase 1 [Anguilla anguilla]|uniref:putative ferric-chelate reductase 1 n=1 Tax=Anguilla anguilla TaxID=7936 RepID=UPI0015B11391|nr:putative ferric-chelate reductase 1 [Anguilla anguilla]
MCQIKLLFIILVGANSLQVVTSYADGMVQSACESMTPKHGSNRPQNTIAPYKIDTNISSSNLDEIMVILRANSEAFLGFLLEAEDSQWHRPVGTFTLIDSAQTQLLSCGGRKDSAVSHTNNHPKNEIRVKWKRPKDGNYTFRATFVQQYSKFWVDELRDPVTTTSPTTITSVTTVKSTVTGTTSRPEQRVGYKESTATELVNLAIPLTYGCLTKMAFYSHSGLWFRVHVSLMSLFAIGNIIALVLVFVDGWMTEAHPVLVCVVTVLTFIQIVVTFCRCGQSHELRFIFNWFHRLNALAIVCLTVATVFTGLASIEANSPHPMLQKLMGGLVAWECLFFILQLLMIWWRKTDQNDSSKKMTNAYTILHLAMLVVFHISSGAFLVVLLKIIFTS